MHYVYVYMRGLSLFPTERALNIALSPLLSTHCQHPSPCTVSHPLRALSALLSVHCQQPSPRTVSNPLRALSASLSVDTGKDANVAEKIHEKETLAVAKQVFQAV